MNNPEKGGLLSQEEKEEIIKRIRDMAVGGEVSFDRSDYTVVVVRHPDNTYDWRNQYGESRPADVSGGQTLEEIEKAVLASN